MTNIITMPFAWVMRLLYSLTGSYGMTLIFFTLVVKLVMLPFQMKSKKSMVRMGRLSSRQAELQKKYANNQQKYQEELQKLYTEAGVNPMGGCLWSFLPLAILLPLYSIVRLPLQYFLRLGTDVIEQIRTLAESVGYVASGSAAYGGPTGDHSGDTATGGCAGGAGAAPAVQDGHTGRHRRGHPGVERQH